MSCIAHPVIDHPMFEDRGAAPGRYLVSDGDEVLPVILWRDRVCAEGKYASVARQCRHLDVALNHHFGESGQEVLCFSQVATHTI